MCDVDDGVPASCDEEEAEEDPWASTSAAGQACGNTGEAGSSTGSGKAGRTTMGSTARACWWCVSASSGRMSSAGSSALLSTYCDVSGLSSVSAGFGSSASWWWWWWWRPRLQKRRFSSPWSSRGWRARRRRCQMKRARKKAPMMETAMAAFSPALRPSEDGAAVAASVAAGDPVAVEDAVAAEESTEEEEEEDAVTVIMVVATADDGPWAPVVEADAAERVFTILNDGLVTDVVEVAILSYVCVVAKRISMV